MSELAAVLKLNIGKQTTPLATNAVETFSRLWVCATSQHQLFSQIEKNVANEAFRAG